MENSTANLKHAAAAMAITCVIGDIKLGLGSGPRGVECLQ